MNIDPKDSSLSNTTKATTVPAETLKYALDWFKLNEWTPFPFQLEAWNAYLSGASGMINAPTGFGKTYSLLIPILLEGLYEQNMGLQKKNGIRAIWISPIRALTQEIKLSAQRAIEGMGLEWQVGVRSGDTNTTTRKKQRIAPPEILITTPESLHILFCSKEYTDLFKDLNALIIDEWHELMGSKRGVQMQLAISRLNGIHPKLKIWAISATIENIEEALEILLGQMIDEKPHVIIRSYIKKHIAVESVLPDEIQKYPWSGHLGIQLLDKIIPIVERSSSTIIFTNTRSQCEIWYQRLLETLPSLAGDMAMHHSSITRELREWVEDAMHQGRLKVVVSTSSLDLGVDFHSVESIIQIGSPKGVSRFIQRAGRSGHRPLATSKIYFVPTHALELVEGAALREAIQSGIQEPRIPYVRSFDVLIQYLMTLAVSDGFVSSVIYEEVKKTHCYNSISPIEWSQVLDFLLQGGKSLQAYDDYHKMVFENGFYQVKDRRIAQRHRMSIGTIVSDAVLNVSLLNGKRLGTIEEYFIASLNIGDAFWFAGQALEFVRLKDMTVQVKKSIAKKARVPAWGGGRLPLSSRLSALIRQKLSDYRRGVVNDIEMDVISSLLDRQKEQSYLVSQDEFLVEYFTTKDGYHLMMYPFEGRNVHQGMSAIIAERLSRIKPISFSIAMNDYGFELLSDQKIDLSLITPTLFSPQGLTDDIRKSVNSIEISRRQFRDIAKISGLIFQGFPGAHKKERHLQSSSGLLFDVFQTYDPQNLLYLQTYEEAMTFIFEESRLRLALQRIQEQTIIVTQPTNFTPFSFPIVVDRLREKISTERLEDKINKMLAFETSR